MGMIISLIAVIFGIGLAGSIAFFAIKSHWEKTRKISAKVSDKEVIEIARQNGGEISAVLLCEKTDLSLDEAQTKINSLLMSGIIHQKWDWSDWSGSKYKYVLKDANKNYDAIEGKKSKIVSDADVISAAIEAKGKITPTALCLKLNISVDEAKRKLEDLHKKEIFEIDVTESGTITYLLADKDLLSS
ncbi:MAG: hypothetical protein MUE81_00350 [Thermoflexibacter sp.]|jgi:predicted transcriptional regulator|nr:hypothetical protein [Thermoflexibacter sp.]